MARHFNHHRKQKGCSSQDSFSYNESFQRATSLCLAIEVFTEVVPRSKVINAFKRSDRIRGPPVPEKLDNSASIFPKFSSQNRTQTALACSNSYPQFPRSPLVTPRTMIPLLARTPARLTTYCAGLCFKSLASRFFYWEQVPSLSSEDSL